MLTHLYNIDLDHNLRSQTKATKPQAWNFFNGCNRSWGSLSTVFCQKIFKAFYSFVNKQIANAGRASNSRWCSSNSSHKTINHIYVAWCIVVAFIRISYNSFPHDSDWETNPDFVPILPYYISGERSIEKKNVISSGKLW